nr:hypothetical protein [uncultured Campylobacter sp.]
MAKFRNFNSQNLAAKNRAKFNRCYSLSIESSPRQNQDASRPHRSDIELHKPHVQDDPCYGDIWKKAAP